MASKDPAVPSETPVWEKFRWILPILVVVLLSRFSVAKDGFSYFSRPIVLGLINLFGGQATDHGTTITVGRLDVPWSGDCAGLNLLVLLLAVAVWMNRREPMGKRYWVRILMMIPAAAIANVLRIFMIIGYREVSYPAIESPQLHYFFGLALLVPFALFAMPKSTRSFSARVFELLHVAAVIALLAPNADGAQGAALTIAVMLLFWEHSPVVAPHDLPHSGSRMGGVGYCGLCGLGEIWYTRKRVGVTSCRGFLEPPGEIRHVRHLLAFPPTLPCLNHPRGQKGSLGGSKKREDRRSSWRTPGRTNVRVWWMTCWRTPTTPTTGQ